MITTYDGDTYFQLQYDGNVIDTATKIDSWIISPRLDYPYFCYFKQGQNSGLVDGVTLTGATSGAVIEVGRVIIPGGTIGGSDAQGILIFKRRSGNIISGENLQGGSSTYCVTTSAALDSPRIKARALFIVVETNSIRFATGGATATNATDTPASFGTILTSTQNCTVCGWKDVKDFNMIHAASGSNAVVNIQVMY